MQAVPVCRTARVAELAIVRRPRRRGKCRVALLGDITAYSGASAQVFPRSSEEIARFFDGLELVDPGLVNVTRWRSDRPSDTPRRSLIYGGVGRKP